MAMLEKKLTPARTTSNAPLSFSFLDGIVLVRFHYLKFTFAHESPHKYQEAPPKIPNQDKRHWYGCLANISTCSRSPYLSSRR